MSTRRLRWLLVIVIVELLTVISIMVWAVLKSDAPPPIKEKETSTAALPTKPLGTLAPALVTTGLTTPTSIVSTYAPGDTRLFVTERPGTIRIVSAEGKLESAPFLDIRSQVKDNGAEMGLLGLAFHPNYAQNGFFYINYIDKNDNTIIARYSATAPGQADPASEKVLIKLKQPYPNHNGGALQFGPDGLLYIALGDGGSAGDPQDRAQDKSSFFGKILRIDVNQGEPYSVPASNPFVGDSGAKPEIWAYGLRNPWRMSFDKKTGDLFIADVGQYQLEEINFQLAASKGGENYGWRCYEGTLPYKLDGCQDANAYVKPILEYEHGDCASITGGYVYRGTRYESMVGTYLYADFCSGILYAAQNQNNSWKLVSNLDTPYSISAFGEDTNGELYFTDLASGALYHLEAN